jgi:hypothetical protein
LRWAVRLRVEVERVPVEAERVLLRRVLVVLFWVAIWLSLLHVRVRLGS